MQVQRELAEIVRHRTSSEKDRCSLIPFYNNGSLQRSSSMIQSVPWIIFCLDAKLVYAKNTTPMDVFTMPLARHLNQHESRCPELMGGQ
eukprot:176166-Amphidinium_carterae.1